MDEIDRALKYQSLIEVNASGELDHSAGEHAKVSIPYRG